MKFHEMTSARLSDVDRDQTVVVIPIGAVEQHGPNMPTGTDAIICTALAEALEKRLVDQVLLTPTVWLGASAHHLRFGATLNSDLETYIATLCDIATSLLDDNFCRILFINGHGGNVDPLRVALREIQPAYPNTLLVGGAYWSVADELIQETLEGDHKFVGHACEFETSMILHLRPELVDQENLSDAGNLVTDQIDGLFVSRDMFQRTNQGFTGRPDLASAEKGKKLFDGIIDRLNSTVQTLLNEPLGTEYREFYS